MITKGRVIEIFCMIDEFDQNLADELKRNLRLPNQNGNGKLDTFFMLAKLCPPKCFKT